jgi:hypothetical protein
VTLVDTPVVGVLCDTVKLFGNSLKPLATKHVSKDRVWPG